jgi:hypothetical protein
MTCTVIAPVLLESILVTTSDLVADLDRWWALAVGGDLDQRVGVVVHGGSFRGVGVASDVERELTGAGLRRNGDGLVGEVFEGDNEAVEGVTRELGEGDVGFVGVGVGIADGRPPSADDADQAEVGQGPGEAADPRLDALGPDPFGLDDRRRVVDGVGRLGTHDLVVHGPSPRGSLSEKSSTQ